MTSPKEENVPQVEAFKEKARRAIIHNMLVRFFLFPFFFFSRVSCFVPYSSFNVFTFPLFIFSFDHFFCAARDSCATNGGKAIDGSLVFLLLFLFLQRLSNKSVEDVKPSSTAHHKNLS